ncbi:MAG TPA: ABC transporter permease [Chloroflexota bacterium]|nr:ABC transporter permease [Chloroflexota bacterium]
MTTYIIRRLVQSIVVLVLASIFFFLLLRMSGSSECGYQSTIVCRQLYSLDQPIAVQYVQWVGNILHGNFGLASDGAPVASEIANAFPVTALLVGVALLFQQLIALPLGILAAVRQYSIADQMLTFLSYSALSIPAFVLAMALVYLIGVQWGLLPTAHPASADLPIFGTGDWFHALLRNPALILGDTIRHLVLPASVLMVGGIAVDSRFMRGAMLQVLHEDYIRTAQAKGLRPRRIILKHAVRNALLPIVTNLGIYLPTLLGGVVIVEAVFTWGGLGYLFYTATGRSQMTVMNGVLTPVFGGAGTASPDIGTLQILLLLGTAAVLLANLLADLAYAWLDPRIRIGAKGEE